ncbi:MIP/aquaporin family protein [Clostridium sp.]|uniref:MIP/aquaporin family protein n=1 Tax=Clostridium sp. TaxID=1506 RepID=UPI003464BC24
MSTFLAELLGTMLLVFLGNGVVANVVLKKSKAEGSGWLTISWGWALAVVIPVFMFGAISGAHFNPAVTIALATIGKFPWNSVAPYLAAQFIGAFLGGTLVLLFFYPHYKETEDKGAKLATFSTAPALRNKLWNFVSEALGTFVLVFGILGTGTAKVAEGFGPVIVGGIVLAIGICLGGTTGYAINPARDLAPRIAHAILPVPNKGDSDWGYSWVPVIGPIVGGILGAILFSLVY